MFGYTITLQLPGDGYIGGPVAVILWKIPQSPWTAPVGPLCPPTLQQASRPPSWLLCVEELQLSAFVLTMEDYRQQVLLCHFQ